MCVAVNPFIGARMFYDNGPVIRLMFSDGPSIDQWLSPEQLRILIEDAVTLLSKYEMKPRGKA